MLRSIVVLGLAEGVGKSSLVATLSAEAARHGSRVAVHDLDRVKRDLERWHAARRSECPALVPFADGDRDGEVPFWEAEQDMVDAGFDLAFVDTSREVWMNVLDAVAAASLVLVVRTPAAVGAEKVEEAMAILRNAGVPFRFVLNRSAGPSDGPTLRAMAELREHGVVLDTAVGEDAAFAVAMDRGLTVGELEPEGAAAADMRRLWSEVWALLSAGGAEQEQAA